jgi:hypothetical protein
LGFSGVWGRTQLHPGPVGQQRSLTILAKRSKRSTQKRGNRLEWGKSGLVATEDPDETVQGQPVQPSLRDFRLFNPHPTLSRRPTLRPVPPGLPVKLTGNIAVSQNCASPGEAGGVGSPTKRSKNSSYAESGMAGSRSAEHLAHLPGEGFSRKGLLLEGHLSGEKATRSRNRWLDPAKPAPRGWRRRSR